MYRAFLKLNRTLHVYLTMLGVAMMSFFAVTGFMLNHEAWFEPAEPHTRVASGQLPAELVRSGDRLAIVEKLRADYGATGAATFESDEAEFRVAFRGPGRKADATIRPDTGAVEITFESRGLVGRLTDLHKGTDAGFAWKRVIDGVAILLAFGAVSGLFLWWSLPKRRKLGVVALLAGVLLSLGAYVALVP